MKPNLERLESRDTPSALAYSASGARYEAVAIPTLDWDTIGYSVEVSRFTSGRKLDPAWGDGGIARLNFGAGNNDINEMVETRDGGLLAVGRFNGQGAVVKLTNRGTLDLSFDGDGRAVVSGTGFTTLRAVELVGASVYVGGNSEPLFDSIRTVPVVVKLDVASGAIDPMFDAMIGLALNPWVVQSTNPWHNVHDLHYEPSQTALYVHSYSVDGRLAMLALDPVTGGEWAYIRGS